MLQSPIYIEMFRSLGGNAVPMAWGETFTAVQQGAIDGLEIPLGVIDQNKYYEVTKYLSLTGHIYSMIGLLIAKRSLDRLPAEVRAAALEAGAEATRAQRAANAEATKGFRDSLATARHAGERGRGQGGVPARRAADVRELPRPDRLGAGARRAGRRAVNAQARRPAALLGAVARGAAWATRASVGLAGAFMLLAIAYQVLMRYVFGDTPSWSEELAVLLFCWTVLGGLALGVHEGYHVRLTVLLDRLADARADLGGTRDGRRDRRARRVPRLVRLAVPRHHSRLRLGRHRLSHRDPQCRSPRSAGALVALFGLERALRPGGALPPPQERAAA